jgi:hypothetical protein
MRHCTEDELILYHYGELRGRARVEPHLQSCATCAAAYRDLAGTLVVASELEVPERDERYGLEVWQRIRHDLPLQEERWWVSWPRLARIGAVASLIVAAFVAGRLGASPPSSDPDLAVLRHELHDLREMLALSLLQQQSATDRLRGVSASALVDQPDSQIVNALLDTLLHDPNVNVRLASVDALRRFSARPDVRQSTIRALEDPSFPLVQVAVIDFLVETKDAGAAGVLQRLSQDSTANEAVRERAAEGLERLTS